MSLKDVSIQFQVFAENILAIKLKTGAPVDSTAIRACRVVILCRCCCFDRITYRRIVGEVEILYTLTPPSTVHLTWFEVHAFKGFINPHGVPAASSVIPHDFVGVVHLFPLLVLVGGPSNGISVFTLKVIPIVVIDVLVSLLLREVGVVWCLALDTPLDSIDCLRLPTHLDVFEVLQVLGILDVILILGLPIQIYRRTGVGIVHGRILVNKTIERFVSGEHLCLQLVCAVGHRLHGIVIAISDCEHQARPANNPGLATPGLFLNVLFEIPGFPLETFEVIHYL